MKTRLVQTITSGDSQFGQVSHPNDLMLAQAFIHERIGNLAHDFLNNQKTSEVVGFSYELDGGNGFGITIKKPGRVYAKDGVVFDLLANAELTIAENETDEPRLDLIVATLEDEINAEMALIPFVQLRTPDEFSENVFPYPPQNINAPQEKHWRTVIQIKTGTPGIIPTVPTLNANEVPLYLVAVAGHAAKIREEDILDLREIILTLRKVNDLVGKNSLDISTLLRRVEKVEVAANQQIDLSQVFGSIRTLGDILAELQRKVNAVRNLPDVRYATPKVPLTDPDSSKIPATGNAVSGVPCVDIEIGGIINFGDTEVVLRPDNFEDPTLNARFVEVTPMAETEKNEFALDLNSVTQISADGFTDFTEKTSEFDASRSRPGCAARNSQFIEIVGGLASDNATALSDWVTYDVDNDTLTPRAPIYSLPNADRSCVIPYGDGTHVLFIAGSEADNTPQCFKLNGETAGITEITTTKPTGIQFFGDLIATNKLFIVAIRKVFGSYETDFWEFNTTTDVFTQLGTTGSVPSLELDYAHGCFYQQNEFVLVKFTPSVPSSGETYIFNRGSATWTKLNIAAPYKDSIAKQNPINRFRVASVNGRPLLMGGLVTKETDANVARIWELSKISTDNETSTDIPKWVAWNATFPPVIDPGFCSTLAGNFAQGKAVFFAGQGKFSDSKKHVYASIQGGLIATSHKGNPAITIADSSTFVQFTVPVHNNSFEVASYLLNFVGIYDSYNLKTEVSFDDGATFHTFAPDKMLLIFDSGDPGKRHLRVTLYNFKSSKPILSNMIEIFDEDGEDLESRIVIRYDIPNADKSLYVDRYGMIRLLSKIAPSTPDECLLHKFQPDGTNPPTVKTYINRRRPHIKFVGTESGTTVSVQFDNNLAVPVRYVNAIAFKNSDKAVYKINDPVIPFDEVVTLTGVASGDHWIIEVEG